MSTCFLSGMETEIDVEKHGYRQQRQKITMNAIQRVNDKSKGGKTVYLNLMDVLLTAGTIIVIVGIAWRAISNLRKGLKKEVLTQARMLENRMDQRASELD